MSNLLKSKKHFQYSIEFHQINMLSRIHNCLAQLMHFRKSSAPTMAIFFYIKKMSEYFFFFCWPGGMVVCCCCRQLPRKIGFLRAKNRGTEKKKLSSREPAIFSKVIVYRSVFSTSAMGALAPAILKNRLSTPAIFGHFYEKLFEIWTDWDVKAVLKISAILL